MQQSHKRLVRRLAITAVILALCLAAVHVAKYYRLRAWRIEVVQQITGVKWPPGASDIHITGGVAAYQQAWLCGHVRISQEAIKDFIRQYHFIKTDDDDLSFVFSLERLPDACAAVQNPGHLHLLTGRTATEFPFQMLLDAKNGSLWFNVVHAR